MYARNHERTLAKEERIWLADTMKKKKINPKFKPSTWEKVDQEHIRGNDAGIEYAMYLGLFVLNDTYDYPAERVYPIIWSIQEDITFLGEHEMPATSAKFEDLGKYRIFDVPGYEDHFRKRGFPLSFEPHVEIDLCRGKPATVQDEKTAFKEGRRQGYRMIRILFLRALEASGDFSEAGLKEFYSYFKKWDDMHREGYASEKEFRQCCLDEYNFSFHSGNVEETEEEKEYSEGWKKYAAERMKEGQKTETAKLIS